MTEQNVSGIPLRASNIEGGMHFVYFCSSKRTHNHVWEELPIFEEVLDREEELTTRQKQPNLVDIVPIFEWDYTQHANDAQGEEENHLQNDEDECN